MSSTHAYYVRYKVFHELLQNAPAYLQHYLDLESKYNNRNEIHFEYLCKLKEKIRNFAAKNDRYKYQIYMSFNPCLTPSFFVSHLSKISSVITKFRLGSHYLPIETGRWVRKPRDERLCPSCNVLGDEHHLIYECIEIDRSGLQLPDNATDLWKSDHIFELFKRIDSLRKFI